MMKIWYCQLDVHGVCKDALDWSVELLEQKNLTLLYTSLAFIWVYVDIICRCIGFTVRLAVPLTKVLGCELFHHCVFIQMVWHKKPISVYFYS